MPVWYVADEFGSRIQHNDQPTIRMIPIFYTPQQMAYSVIFPIQSMNDGGIKLIII